MANLRTAMDSAFWDQAVSSPKTLEGCVKSVPSQAFPVDVCRASRALRIQQLSIFTSLFPFGIVPSISPTPHDPHLGSLALQSSFFKLSLPNWWLGLVGQIRPKKLISSIRQNFFNAELKNAVLDDSLYSIGAYTQFSLTRSTSLVLSTERIGDKKTPRHKFMVYHQHRRHDVTLEAAVPEVFVDNRKDGYWNVPHSVSLDVASVPGKDGGVLYRFGLHGNAGRPTPHHALDTNTVDAAEVPSDLMPGLCAKAACSYQKIKDFWRITPRLDKPDSIVPYDIQLCQPHSALSGIVGASCAAWLIGEDGIRLPNVGIPIVARARRNRKNQARSKKTSPVSEDLIVPVWSKKRNPVSADMFGSVCYTFQHGKFSEPFGDLTRLDARLDIFSATALSKGLFNMFRNSLGDPDNNTLSSPRLNCIFQQQVAGPVLARVDSRFAVGRGAHLEDVIYSLSYSVKALPDAKVVAWYSPKRKEGMVELRVAEF